jgi:hypothetical protein
VSGDPPYRAETPASTNSSRIFQPRSVAYWRMAWSWAGMDSSFSTCLSVDTRASVRQFIIHLINDLIVTTLPIQKRRFIVHPYNFHDRRQNSNNGSISNSCPGAAARCVLKLC